MRALQCPRTVNSGNLEMGCYFYYFIFILTCPLQLNVDKNSVLLLINLKKNFTFFTRITICADQIEQDMGRCPVPLQGQTQGPGFHPRHRFPALAGGQHLVREHAIQLYRDDWFYPNNVLFSPFVAFMHSAVVTFLHIV